VLPPGVVPPAGRRVERDRALGRRAGDLRAAGLRVVAGLAALAVERGALALFARVPAAFLRAAGLARVPVAFLRAAGLPALALDFELAPLSPHLPDITRWAASATASAMIEPNLVALAIMLLAACDAVSAASSPASRILRRATGLALIAAAAAARPAAIISLLIAALASLSAVLPPDPEEDRDEDLDEVFRVDLAIA
jgi:hypothetical protein